MEIKNLNILPAAYRHLVRLYFLTDVEATILSATLKGDRLIIKYKLHAFLDTYHYDISGFGDYVEEEYWREVEYDDEDNGESYLVFKWNPMLSVGEFASLIKCSTYDNCYWFKEHFDEYSYMFLKFV